MDEQRPPEERKKESLKLFAIGFSIGLCLGAWFLWKHIYG